VNRSGETSPGRLPSRQAPSDKPRVLIAAASGTERKRGSRRAAGSVGCSSLVTLGRWRETAPFRERRRCVSDGSKRWASAVASTRMDGDALKAAYRRWLLEVWGAGRYEVADELLHVDLVDHNRLEGQPDGRAGDVWAAEMVRRAFPDLRFVPDLVVADGKYVVGRWTMTGTNTGPFELFGLPPTGRPVTMTGQEIFRSDGEQFIEVWHQEDVPGMLEQLGLQPPQIVMRLAARQSAWRYRRAQDR
jgi:predicted ester cyclase